jgi:hypothetical protein
MENPKKQKQQVIWYLYNWNEFSLKDVIEDSLFHKFQTRLNEIESKFGVITKKVRHSFTNRFGNSGSFYTYESIDKSKLEKLFYEV